MAKQTPKPGKPVRGSQSGRPIMAALDLLGRRWTLRIVWELRETAATFRQLRTRCDNVSPSVLNTRLSELREASIVDVGDDGYQLSELGHELLAALKPLHGWASRWHTATR